MPFYVSAPDMPIVVEYPDDDDPKDIADLYNVRIEAQQVWPYYLGQDGQDGAVIVNYGALAAVIVTPEPPAWSDKPQQRSTLHADRRASGLFDHEGMTGRTARHRWLPWRS